MTTGLTKHIYREKSCKTVCVSNVLAALQIPTSFYQSTGTNRNPHAYRNVIRRAGMGVRSRMSKIGKGTSVGGARAKIAAMHRDEDVKVVAYMVLVHKHLILLSPAGRTIVDTDARKADRRKILAIHAITLT